MRATWEAMAGRRQNGAGGHFRQFDPARGGIGYLLKMIDHDHGDWSFRNLDLFLPADASAQAQGAGSSAGNVGTCAE